MFTFRLWGGVRDVDVVEQDAAFGRLLEEPAIMRSVVVLPQPEARAGEELAAGGVEVDGVHRRQLAEPLLSSISRISRRRLPKLHHLECRPGVFGDGPARTALAAGERTPDEEAGRDRDERQGIMTVAMAFVDGAAPLGWPSRSGWDGVGLPRGHG